MTLNKYDLNISKLSERQKDLLVQLEEYSFTNSGTCRTETWWFWDETVETLNKWNESGFITLGKKAWEGLLRYEENLDDDGNLVPRRTEWAVVLSDEAIAMAQEIRTRKILKSRELSKNKWTLVKQDYPKNPYSK